MSSERHRGIKYTIEGAPTRGSSDVARSDNEYRGHSIDT